MSGFDRLPRAFTLAYELHRDQIRKGSETPYFTHLMAVAAIVGGYGGTEDQVIAALLHDAMEDQGGRPTLERIRAEFGDQVARFVDECSDTDEAPKPPWTERKRAFIARIREASPEVRLIVAADKLHNGRSLLNDFRLHGSALWLCFKGGCDGTLWYQAEVARALADGWTHPILVELAQCHAALEEAIRASEAIAAPFMPPDSSA